MVAGGCALNVAAALGRHGRAVAHAGLRGPDAAGATVAGTLAAHGVADLALVRDDLATGRYTALVEPDGTLALAAAAMEAYGRAELLARHAPYREAALSADALVLDANGPPGAVAALAAARGRGTRLVLLATSPRKAPHLAAVLGEAALLFANEAEWAAMNVSAAMEGSPPRLAVVTDGARGVRVLENGREALRRPSRADLVRDVIGAGDALAAGTIHAWLAGAPIAVAVERGLDWAARCLAHPDALGWLAAAKPATDGPDAEGEAGGAR